MENTHTDEQKRMEDVGITSTAEALAASNQSSVDTRIKQLELENLDLRRRAWRVAKDPKPVGIILSSVGGAILALSYVLSSSILTFVGLGLAFWGVLVIYARSSRHVHGDVLSSISSSMQKCVDEVVKYMGFSGDVIFFHPKHLSGIGQGHVFIAHLTANTELTIKDKVESLNLLPYNSEVGAPSIYLHPKGMFLVAPSQGLVDLFEKELGINLSTVDFPYIQHALPRLLIEDLKIVDDLSIDSVDSASFVLSFHGGPSSEMCIFSEKNTHLGKHLGCPLCSAVALVISKIAGKPVMIKQTRIGEEDTITTEFAVLSS
jgi:hypothetical protein